MKVISNVSHYAHIRREDKISKMIREEANEKSKGLIEKHMRNGE